MKYIYNTSQMSKLSLCHMQVHLSGKLHPHGDATSEPYKPTVIRRECGQTLGRVRVRIDIGQ